MVVIKLYGILEEIAQRSLQVRVKTFDEAMRALMANFPKLRKAIMDMRLSILIDGREVKIEDLLRPMVESRIDIMPVVGGTGPAIGIVLGAALTYGASTIATYVGTAFLLSEAIVAGLTSFISNMGVALILGGVSQILFKPPKPSLGSERPDTAPSYMFNGPVNTVSQGNPVPVGFGKMIVGSQVISTNVQTVDIPVAKTTAPAPAPAPAPPPPITFIGTTTPFDYP